MREQPAGQIPFFKYKQRVIYIYVNSYSTAFTYKVARVTVNGKELKPENGYYVIDFNDEGTLNINIEEYKRSSKVAIQTLELELSYEKQFTMPYIAFSAGDGMPVRVSADTQKYIH